LVRVVEEGNQESALGEKTRTDLVGFEESPPHATE